MFLFSETIPFDYRTYFAAAIPFLEQYSWIFRYNNTKFIRSGVLEALSREWIVDLDTLSNEEFNQIPLGLYKLVQFISRVFVTSSSPSGGVRGVCRTRR
uniref:Uncharacterized protein n=1 Tax=Anopheles coluzzii TaxID=1518534 RepID=A0A6E8VQM7_ANOCL